MDRPSPGGITWTIAGERLALLAWPRAILLQLAHPLVAAGVAEHSGFRSSPFAPFARLHATVGAMRQLTFGTDEEAAAVVRRIRGIHDRVNGTLREAAGPHASGTRYSAHDPALLLWVHATLLDSHVRILEQVLRPFTPDERDRYCGEAAVFASVLGAPPDDLPRTWRELQDFIAAQIESGRVTVGADARALAPAILRPAFGWLLWPLQVRRRTGDHRFPAARGPERLRIQVERHAGAAHQRVAALRATRALTPDSFARWPEAGRVRNLSH